MVIDDQDQGDLPEDGVGKSISIQKKLLIILTAAVVVVAVLVSIFNYVSAKKRRDLMPFGSVMLDDGSDAVPVVVYNMPEIATGLKTSSHEVLMRISLEFEDEKNVEKIEVLLPRIQDIIVFMTSEVLPSELKSSKGLYWFKEEMLHRINLVLSPLEIKNIRFRSFDVIGGGEENE